MYSLSANTDGGFIQIYAFQSEREFLHNLAISTNFQNPFPNNEKR